MQLKIRTKSDEETSNLAKTIAMSLTSPCVVNLVGEMGAGKTTFTKGFALGLGCTELVSSPTFTIMNNYHGKVFEIFHFDFYRINSFEEIEELGFGEYFDENTLKGITLVEWAERASFLMPKKYLEVEITKISESEREFLIRQVEK